MAERDVTTAARTVGVVGLGNMGGRMTQVLLEEYPVVVYDIDAERVSELERAGATSATSASDLAAEADVVLVSVPSDEELEAATLGEGGVLEGLDAGDVLIDTSTVSPMASRRVAEACAGRDVGFLDAPVSGGARNAGTGSLTVLVGGPGEVLESVRDVVETIGETIHHVGGTGAGVSLKVVNNYVFGMNQIVVCEAMLMARAAGIPDEVFAETLSDASGGSYALDRNAERFYLADQHRSEFTLSLMRKDTAIAEAFANDHDVPLLTGGASGIYRVAESLGLADFDSSAVLKLYERAMNVDAGSNAP